MLVPSGLINWQDTPPTENMHFALHQKTWCINRKKTLYNANHRKHL
jgi:hypothetical protein